MKKYAIILALIGLAFLVAACSGGDNPAEEIGSVPVNQADAIAQISAQLTQQAPVLNPTLTALAALPQPTAVPSGGGSGGGGGGGSTTGGSVGGGTGLRQWATSATASSEYDSVDWAASQATGEPDVYPECADSEFSWTPLTGDNAGEFLQLTYDTAVTPTQIEIYETWNPGTVVKVEVANDAGERLTVYEGQAVDLRATDTCPNVTAIPVTGVEGKFNQVIITIDQTVLASAWTEIDAVELVGEP
jgi:hypothetical protein